MVPGASLQGSTRFHKHAWQGRGGSAATGVAAGGRLHRASACWPVCWVGVLPVAALGAGCWPSAELAGLDKSPGCDHGTAEARAPRLDPRTGVDPPPGVDAHHHQALTKGLPGPAALRRASSRYPGISDNLAAPARAHVQGWPVQGLAPPPGRLGAAPSVISVTCTARTGGGKARTRTQPLTPSACPSSGNCKD